MWWARHGRCACQSLDVTRLVRALSWTRTASGASTMASDSEDDVYDDIEFDGASDGDEDIDEDILDALNGHLAADAAAEGTEAEEVCLYSYCL